MLVIDRILQFIENQHISQNEFCKITKLNPATISNTKIQKGNLKESTLQAILTAYPKMSCRWLLLGEGEMWEKEKPAGSESIRVENNQIGNNVNVQQLLGGCEKEVARLKREIQLLEEINQLLRQKNQ